MITLDDARKLRAGLYHQEDEDEDDIVETGGPVEPNTNYYGRDDDFRVKNQLENFEK